MTDLDKLIAAVEAGTLCQGDTISEADGDLIAACFPLLDDEVGAWEYVALAMDGSLDAAKILMDALLPWMFWNMGHLHMPSLGYVCTVAEGHFADSPSWRGYAMDPARAWLLAILRAVKAKEA